MRYIFFICVLISFIVVCLPSCSKFEYSPYQQETAGETTPRDLNIKNLEKLQRSKPNGDTLTIIFTGDSQRFYGRLQKLVARVNTLSNIDFVVIAGDIADFGILKEYLWVLTELEKLKVPFFAAIGNHDLAADKGEAFERIFGPKNFNFTYKGYQFLFHDTNGREYGFNGRVPDLAWLSNTLAEENLNGQIAVSHIAPYNHDFDQQLSEQYMQLFSSAKNFLVSLHGHDHDTKDLQIENVRYLTSNSVQKSEVLLLKFADGKIFKQHIPY